MKRLMDKAKTSEWVKLIDCDYERSQSMIKIDSNKYYEMKFEKKSRTWVQVFS